MAELEGHLTPSDVGQPPVGQGTATGPLGNMSPGARERDNRRKEIDRVRGQHGRWSAIAAALYGSNELVLFHAVEAKRLKPLEAELAALVAADLAE